MTQVDYVELMGFMRRFYAGEFGDQRLGQAFFNEYLQAEDDPVNELFYQTSNEESIVMIWSKYLTKTSG